MSPEIIAVVMLIIIETILWFAWNPIYFRFGIPIYVKRLAVTKNLDTQIEPRELEEALKGGVYRNFLFKLIGEGQIAFRESGGVHVGVSYSPVMHGLISVREQNISVIGYLNWSIPLLIWLLVKLAHPPLVVIGFVVVLLGVLYFIQARRFNQILEVLKSQCAI